MVLNFSFLQRNNRDTQRQFSENIRSEDDLRPRIFGTFLVKFLPVLGFPNIEKKWYNCRFLMDFCPKKVTENFREPFFRGNFRKGKF